MPALNPNEYAYLWSPTRQMLDKNGKPLVGGYVMLDQHGTPGLEALSYSDWNGTLNARRILLDNLGRGAAIVENDKLYDMYVYNRFNVLMWSSLGLNCSGEGGGDPLRFTSSDGTVIINRVGNVVDLRVHSDEKIFGSIGADSVGADGLLEFDDITTGDVTIVTAGTIQIGRDKLYHVTVNLEIDTDTVGDSYYDCYLIDSENKRHKFYLDGSRHNQFVDLSWDAVSTGNAFRLWINTPSNFRLVNAELFLHSVNALVGQRDELTFDDELSTTSENAVQNKVVTAAINEKANSSDLAPLAFSGSWNDLENIPSSIVYDPNYVHTERNFTAELKSKLEGIEAGAQVNVQADWNEADSSKDSFIKNKPQNLVQDANYVHTDNNFTDNDKTKLAGIQAGAQVNVQADWNQTNSSADDYIKNKPDLNRYALIADLAAVAFSGDYDDLTGKPDLSVFARTADLAAVAFSGAYSDLSGAPDLDVYTPKDAVASDWVSGTTIANGSYRWSNNKVYRAKKYLSSANNTTAPHLDSTNWEQVSIISASSALYHYFEASTGPTLSSTQVLTAIASGRPLYLVEYTTSGTSRSYGKAYGLVYYGNQGTNDIIFGTIFQKLQPDQTTKMWIFGWRKLHYVPTVSDPTAQDVWTTGSTSLGVFYRAGTGISIVDRTDGTKTINCTLDPFPSHTASDEDKVLTVNSLNELIWKTVAAVAYSGDYYDLSNRPSIPPPQVNSDWTETDTTKKSFILNKPTKTFITAGQNVNIVEVDNQLVISATGGGGGGGSVDDVTVNGTSVVNSSGVAVIDLTSYVLASALAAVATSGDYSDLSNTPDLSVYALISSLAAVATSGDYTDLSNKPDLSVYALASSLAAVATSGSYSDLSNKPDLSVYALASSLATVATSGSYNDLNDKPTIPTITYTTSQEVTDILADLT